MLSIAQRQLNLKTFNYYYKLEVDGIEGNGTIQAYWDFQKDYHMVVDGIYGNDTEFMLLSAVRGLQAKLNEYGYNLVVDGIVGDYTIAAIKDFQEKHGLVVDGIAGIETFKALGKYQCVYFTEDEFKCECGCGFNICKNGIKKIADEIREHFCTPVIVTSGTRCKTYNDSLSGSIVQSCHRTGNAIDIIARGVSGSELLAYCKQIVSRGSAAYTYQIDSEAVHIDTGTLE